LILSAENFVNILRATSSEIIPAVRMPHHTGLIQVTAAFHHIQRNNPLGTALLLKAALARLERYPAHFEGISVNVLCDDIRESLLALVQAVGTNWAQRGAGKSRCYRRLQRIHVAVH
jgi:predicted metal-dependent hydrolase